MRGEPKNIHWQWKVLRLKPVKPIQNTKSFYIFVYSNHWRSLLSFSQYTMS